MKRTNKFQSSYAENRSSILIVVDSLRIGGAQRSAINLAEDLYEIGCNVQVLIYRDKYDIKTIYPIPIIYLKIFGLSKIGFFGFVDRVLHRVFGIIYSVFMSKIYSKKLSAVLLKINPDLVIFSGASSYIPFIYAKARNKIAVLHSVKSKQFFLRLSTINSAIAKYVFRLVYSNMNVVCISHEIYQDQIDFFQLYPQSVIFNPVSFNKINDMSRAFPVPSVSYYWIYVGRLDKNKRVADIILSINLVDKKKRRKLVIVGDGPERCNLITLAKNLHVDVLFTGSLSNPYPWIKGAEKIVLASKREGLPIVIIEAAYLGVEIIASKSCNDLKYILGQKYELNTFEVGNLIKLSELLTRPASKNYKIDSDHINDLIKKFDGTRIAREYIGFIDKFEKTAR